MRAFLNLLKIFVFALCFFDNLIKIASYKKKKIGMFNFERRENSFYKQEITVKFSSAFIHTYKTESANLFADVYYFNLGSDIIAPIV